MRADPSARLESVIRQLIETEIAGDTLVAQLKCHCWSLTALPPWQSSDGRDLQCLISPSTMRGRAARRTDWKRAVCDLISLPAEFRAAVGTFKSS